MRSEERALPRYIYQRPSGSYCVTVWNGASKRMVYIGTYPSLKVAEIRVRAALRAMQKTPNKRYQPKLTCKYGHPLYGSNLSTSGNVRDRRRCRACHRDHVAQYKKRRAFLVHLKKTTSSRIYKKRSQG